MCDQVVGRWYLVEGLQILSGTKTIVEGFRLFPSQRVCFTKPPLAEAPCFQAWEEAGVPSLGQGRGGFSCLGTLVGTKRARSEMPPGQDSTVLDLCSLRQSFVGTIGMQADRLPFPVKASYDAQPIFGMFGQGSPFQSETSRASIGLAFSP